jgi:hypothetical protein
MDGVVSGLLGALDRTSRVIPTDCGLWHSTAAQDEHPPSSLTSPQGQGDHHHDFSTIPEQRSGERLAGERMPDTEVRVSSVPGNRRPGPEVPMDMVHPITTRSAVLTLTLGALALSGWGAFAYAGRSAAAVESELTAQVSRLEVEREQLHAERTRLQESVKEVHGRLAAAREEQSRGVRARDQARADLATAQQQLATLTKRLDQANGRVAQTGAVMPPPAPIQIAQRLKQRVAQAWSGRVPVPPARIPERVNERAR